MNHVSRVKETQETMNALEFQQAGVSLPRRSRGILQIETVRFLKPRSSRSEIRTCITLRSVRSQRPDKALLLPSAGRGLMGQRRLIAHSIRERIAEFRLF